MLPLSLYADERLHIPMTHHHMIGLDGHVDDVIEVCFQYIAMLQASAKSELGGGTIA